MRCRAPENGDRSAGRGGPRLARTVRACGDSGPLLACQEELGGRRPRFLLSRCPADPKEWCSLLVRRQNSKRKVEDWPSP
ncbi:hypothetical protein NDU88_001495 [Pleurodeles waltl]|uniref:Uncharacterized protein n=1 Tax=Pleurodeles waltl TaxID=8319 RepID=A0AAV7U711_PLEWA|nr:hypothetical protein NDU88_001495 [Pleurodeles waltl]